VPLAAGCAILGPPPETTGGGGTRVLALAPLAAILGSLAAILGVKIGHWRR